MPLSDLKVRKARVAAKAAAWLTELPGLAAGQSPQEPGATSARALVIKMRELETENAEGG